MCRVGLDYLPVGLEPKAVLHQIVGLLHDLMHVVPVVFVECIQRVVAEWGLVPDEEAKARSSITRKVAGNRHVNERRTEAAQRVAQRVPRDGYRRSGSELDAVRPGRGGAVVYQGNCASLG